MLLGRPGSDLFYQMLSCHSKNNIQDKPSLVKYRRFFNNGRPLQCVIINKSDDKKTVRSRLEDSAVDYWAVHVGGTKNNNKHFYTMIKWF